MKNLFFLLTFISLNVKANNPDSAHHYFKIGMDQKIARLFQQASISMDKAISFDQTMFDAYLQNGFINKEMRRTDAALKNFLAAWKLQPSNELAAAELMQIYFDYRQFSKAFEVAESCKNCANSNRVKGIGFYHQEDYAQSTKYLSIHLAKVPDDTEALYFMARSYVDMEEYKKAIPYFEKVIAQPSAKPLWIYEAGLLYYTLFDPANAVKAFDKAASAGYAATNDFNENLGFACIESGDFQRGEELLYGVWKKKPGNKDIPRNMAQIFCQKKQYDLSLKYCQLLLEADPNDAKALYQAGLTFQKKGDKDRGQQMCDKAIAMDPSLESLRRKKEIPGM